MMKNSARFIAAAAITLLSCGDPDTSLVGQLEVSTMVNPDVGLLIADNQLTAIMSDEQTILGIGSRHVFETKNDFTSFSVAETTNNDLSHVAYMTDVAIVCYELNRSHYFDPFVLYRSTNKGGAWDKVEIPGIGNGVIWVYDVMKIQLFDQNQGIMMINNWSYINPANTLFYSVNLDNANATLVGRIDGYMPITIKYLNATYGYVLLHKPINNNSNNTFISRTTDGGVTWSVPTMVDATSPIANIEVLSQTGVLVFEYGKFYHSNDAGVSWNSLIIPNYDQVRGVSFLNGSTGFMITANGMVSKSTNGGQTWTSIGDVAPVPFGAEFYNIHFYNESSGIVYGRNQMFKTNDGGQSWKVLIFPFEYVIGK